MIELRGYDTEFEREAGWGFEGQLHECGYSCILSQDIPIGACN